jgi:predicted Zn-dependent peptidase
MIRKERLPNGLTLISETMPHVRSISLGVWLRKGSRHEPAALNGASHFLEHLVFKGTEDRTAREIALIMDSVGGQMDAFTSKEYTCFYAKVLDEHLDTAMDILADLVRRPRFDPAELERERQVVVEEIRMVEDTPDELLYDLFAQHFYPRHPLGRPIQGTEATVSSWSRGRLLRFFREAYRPGNMLIVAAGNIRHARLSRLVRQAFGSMPKGGGRIQVGPPPRAASGVFTRHKRNLEQLHLLLGVPAYPENFRGRYPLFVLNALLGGTMSSRLFQKVREERGLAYAVYSAVNAFLDTGFLMVYAATSPRRGDETVRVVLDELRSLRDRGPEEAELEMAKEHLKGSLMLSLESTASRMSNLARQEIYFGRQFSLEETLSGIAPVTTRDVQRLCKGLFQDGHLTLAALGNLQRFKTRAQGLHL